MYLYSMIHRKNEMGMYSGVSNIHFPIQICTRAEVYFMMLRYLFSFSNNFTFSGVFYLIIDSWLIFKPIHLKIWAKEWSRKVFLLVGISIIPLILHITIHFCWKHFCSNNDNLYASEITIFREFKNFIYKRDQVLILFIKPFFLFFTWFFARIFSNL
jgi:hypothetical protein